MKTIYTLLIALLAIAPCFSQSFINGDFETNTASGCTYNLTDSAFNTKISNVTAFGKGYAASSGGFVGEIDMQTSNCFVNPQSGNWCLGLSSDVEPTSDAFALELTSNLIAGNTYELTFHLYGNSSFQNGVTNIEIGETLSDTTFGNFIDSITPDAGSWKRASIIFRATQNASHITVRTKIGQIGWTQVDSFAIAPSSMVSVQKYPNEGSIKIYPNPTSNQVTLDFQQQLSTGVVSIMNSSGQLLKRVYISNQKGLSLDLSAFPSGLYFIQMESDKVVESIKIVKE